MIIEVPVLSFTRIHAEPGAAGYVYALRTTGILSVTQSIPRLAREVLYQVYTSTVNISSLYRAVNKENKRRRSCSLGSISLQELNHLVREHGGANIITSCPALWEIDVTSVRDSTPLRFSTKVVS